MARLIIAALPTLTSYLLPDRFRWRKITLLVIGIAGSIWSFLQGYANLRRVAYLETKVGSVECIQSQASGRHFTPDQRRPLEKRLSEFSGLVVNVSKPPFA